MYVSQQKHKRGFSIPLDIILAMGREGVGLEQLQTMVALSTRVTHPKGNYRYRGYLFRVDGKRVVAYGKLQDNVVVEEEVPEVISYHEAVSTVSEEL